MIKLKHQAAAFDSSLVNWLGQKVVGYSGPKPSLWMHHAKHLDSLSALFDSDADIRSIDVSSGITAKNMVSNYQLISKELDARLTDKKMFETFVYYFLLRLVIINLSVEQTDVPMVFEAINDRGVKLKPYEILKGKLLGQIDKVEMDTCDFNALWDDQISRINDYADDEADNFFRYYLKAKFAATKSQAQEFDGDYHRAMFSRTMDDKLGLEHNSTNVKAFLKDEFRYYSELYLKYWQATEKIKPSLINIYYNELNNLHSQCILMLAACEVNDPEETEKMNSVAGELDRLFTLSQLQGGYDSSRFAVEIYAIASKLIDATMADYRGIFDESLTRMLADQREDEVNEPFRYAFFKNASVASLNKRFIRYFFTRVEVFVAGGMRQDMRHSTKDLVLNTRAANSFHVEHILSRNEENLAYFNNDEEIFEQQRNRLGGILLLKGKDNISSGNELYKNKLKSYGNTLYWNETLREDSYKSKLDFRNFIKAEGLDFEHCNMFGEEQLEARHKLLFEVAKRIWA